MHLSNVWRVHCFLYRFRGQNHATAVSDSIANLLKNFKILNFEKTENCEYLKDLFVYIM